METTNTGLPQAELWKQLKENALFICIYSNVIRILFIINKCFLSKYTASHIFSADF